MAAPFGDRADLYAARGNLVTGPDGKTTFDLGERLRIYMESPADEFDFWLKREAARDGSTFSREAIDGVFEEVKRFFMARAMLRVEEGHPPDEAYIEIRLRFAPEPLSPQPYTDGEDAMHRATTLRGLPR